VWIGRWHICIFIAYIEIGSDSTTARYLYRKRESEESQYREVTRSEEEREETVIRWRYREIILHPSPSLKDPPMEKKCE